MVRYRKAVFSALWVPSALVFCYVQNLTVEIVICTSINRLYNFIIIVIIICYIGECFIFFNSILNPFLYRWQIRYKRSTKADNPTSNLPYKGFDLFRRLHTLFLPKLFINEVCHEYNLIKSKENHKELLLIFILYSSYIKSNRKVKNLISVTISQEYHMPNLHEYNEAVETISAFQAECMILLFFQNLDETYHFGSDIRSIYIECNRSLDLLINL